MGTLVASTLIAQASETANDENNVVWTQPQALAWLNDGQRAVAMVRPDASVLRHAVQLAAGTRQGISGVRLLSIPRNMGTDGLTPGRAVRLVERALKDDLDPDWHASTAATEVREYIFDDRNPREYYVWPPVHASTPVYVELIEAVSPADIADTGSVITLDDIYAPALIEWEIYRFFSRDAEEVQDIQRASSHFQAFFALLGEKVKVDMAVSPKVRAHLE